MCHITFTPNCIIEDCLYTPSVHETNLSLDSITTAQNQPTLKKAKAEHRKCGTYKQSWRQKKKKRTGQNITNYNVGYRKVWMRHIPIDQYAINDNSCRRGHIKLIGRKTIREINLDAQYTHYPKQINLDSLHLVFGSKDESRIGNNSSNRPG